MPCLIESFSIEELSSVEYLVQSKLLVINRNTAFICRLFPEKDIDTLLEILSIRHGIKTGKI